MVQGCVRVELHQALGLKYQPLGFCQVKCRDLIGASGGKFHGRGQLIGMEPLLSKCVDVGSVEFWMKLKIPITHSAKLYQVRVIKKAAYMRISIICAGTTIRLE